MVYLGGEFSSVNSSMNNRSNMAAVLKTTGSLASWNPTANGPVFSLSVSNGVVYAGGAFTTINGNQQRQRVAAIKTTNEVLNWNPGANDTVRVVKATQSVVYVGGRFTQVGGQSRKRIAAIHTNGTMIDWSQDLNGEVRALALNGLGVYAGWSYFMSSTRDQRYYTVFRAPLVISGNIGLTPREGSVREEEQELLKSETLVQNFTMRTFPNPSAGQFTVELELAAPEKIELRVVNMLGQTVFSSESMINAGNQSFPVNLNSIENGTYFVQIQAGNSLKALPVQIAR
jgi:hypothetical protein